ncbi:MAG: diadenylate cyclase CdaA [Clostridia bacterium]|nr:diadenylate cyclase CdaA [Clostridia bacterium]
MWNVLHRTGFTDVLDILIVAVILYEILMLVRHTRGSAVLKGLVVLVLAGAVSQLLGMTALNWILSSMMQYGVIVLFILFQPELRHALEQVGRGAMLDSGTHVQDEDNERIIREVIQTLLDLSRRRVGALIVFEQKTGLQDLIETGTRIDGRISAPLLENIFEPNTPLHDGAVIVRGQRVIAGACILNLTENRDVNRELGTRHRAALGVSETTDAITLVVSEETGVISMTKAGEITRNLDEKKLRDILSEMYLKKDRFSLSSLIQRFRGKGAVRA